MCGKKTPVPRGGWMPRVLLTSACALSAMLCGCRSLEKLAASLQDYWYGEDLHGKPLRSPYPTTRTIAVAPFVNFTGRDDFDPVHVADIFYRQLQAVRGLEVLPVNHCLRLLLAKGQSHIGSAEEALKIAEALGADAILVGAVNEYDPYDPPKLAVALQLYARPGRLEGATLSFDPLTMTRSPVELSPPPSPAAKPKAQVLGIYSAADHWTIKAMKRYNFDHNAHDSPYGWRQYSADMDKFIEFVAHEMIRRMLEKEYNRLTVLAQEKENAH